MRMRSLLLLFFLTSVLSLRSYGQQLPQSSFVEDAKHYWNPAATAAGTDIRTSLFFRQQWLGFGAAPRTGFVSMEYPFIDLNMSAGALINFDQTGPVSKMGLHLLYAYKLRGVLTDDGQLSLGINVGMSQYSFDPNATTFGDEGDVLLQGGRATAFYPTVTGGIYYMSSTEQFRENVFFVGLALRDGFATQVLVNDSDQIRERHLHFNIGTRVYQDYSYIEPSLTVNMTRPDIVDIRAGLRYEMRETFWVGLGYGTINEVNFQGGYILPEIGDKYGRLRVGVLGAINVSENASNLGPGFEFFVGYLYDLD